MDLSVSAAHDGDSNGDGDDPSGDESPEFADDGWQQRCDHVQTLSDLAMFHHPPPMCMGSGETSLTHKVSSLLQSIYLETRGTIII